MYSERPSVIPGAVVWQKTYRSDAPDPDRVLPDGCMDLLWMRGEVLVAGPDTGVYRAGGAADERYVGLRFAPGALPALLDVPARELTDRRVALRDLLADRIVRRLVERLVEADAPGRVLEAFPASYAALRTRSRTSTRTHQRHRARRADAATGAVTGGAVGQAAPLVTEVARLLEAGTPVATVAAHVGFGTRQLHRLSLEHFGYGPKTLASILRFQRALRLAPTERSAATLALRAGYADQAHLIRETRRLAGTTFGSLIDSAR